MEDTNSRYKDSSVQDNGEIIRKRYLYRRLILSRKVNISAKSRLRMVGPDCAYHLYGSHTGRTQKAEKRK